MSVLRAIKLTFKDYFLTFSLNIHIFPLILNLRSLSALLLNLRTFCRVEIEQLGISLHNNYEIFSSIIKSVLDNKYSNWISFTSLSHPLLPIYYVLFQGTCFLSNDRAYSVNFALANLERGLHKHLWIAWTLFTNVVRHRKAMGQFNM